MVKARKYVVKNRTKGIPKRDDFEIVEYEVPPINNGEILIKTEWFSVDPYLTPQHNNLSVPYDQFGFNVGQVIDSKDPRYPVGTKVVSHNGWCDYTIVNTAEPESISFIFGGASKLHDLKGLRESLGVGIVGMAGATAYFGFLEICAPKAGETVVVTGAAGAVGSIVGQIAKIKGCKVIGFAGSDEKVAWLEKELGFDKAINYKTANVDKALKEAAPEGIDCFFDNVGGEISSKIMYHMNVFGRVSICGGISAYNDTNLPVGTLVQPAILTKQLKVEGFLVDRWIDRWSEAFVDLVKWITSGQLKPVEHVTEGFDKLFDALVGMLNGENFGKAVVKI